MDKPQVSTIYRIESGILSGTEISPFMAMLLVKYPHRKTKDVYFPPVNGKTKSWHCVQCDKIFDGGFPEFIEHLMLHKGRLLKQWSKKEQVKSPLPAVKIPPNEWEGRGQGMNEDRRFILELYITNLKHWLNKQGLEVIETENKKEKRK